jgi:hypothetical protein
MLSDADLLRAAQGGDAASLGILLERYRAALYGQGLGIHCDSLSNLASKVSPDCKL